MKTTKKQTLSEIHYWNSLNEKNLVKIGRKVYSVYCVARNKIDVYHCEYIFILQDMKGEKIYFDSDTKAALIM